MNKKGLSPLIATILLVAFAIALGVVVMSLPTILNDSNTDPVQGCGVYVGLKIEDIGGVKQACLKQNGAESYFQFTLTNGGTTEIVDFKVNIIGSEALNLESIGEPMAKGETKMIKIPYDVTKYGQALKVRLIPKIPRKDEIILCDSSAVEIESIRSC